MKSRKKIRCNHCSERFASKDLCRAHIRVAHRNKQHGFGKQIRNNDKSSVSGSKISSASHAKFYSCDRCSYTCTEYRNLRIHQVCLLSIISLSSEDNSHIMRMYEKINISWLLTVVNITDVSCVLISLSCQWITVVDPRSSNDVNENSHLQNFMQSLLVLQLFLWLLCGLTIWENVQE